MMTPKMKEDLCTQILNASRQLFLSSKISEVCQEKGTQKQLEFVLELMNKGKGQTTRLSLNPFLVHT